jgi:tripartite-type tricarboxylate transporter receptor subunit TctC
MTTKQVLWIGFVMQPSSPIMSARMAAEPEGWASFALAAEIRDILFIDRVHQAGKLRPLAVTTATRWEGLPNLPTVGDFVPGYEASGWFGVGAPKNTPAAIIDVLNKEIIAILADPKTKARIADLGGTVLALSPSDFGKLIAEETEKWAKVVKLAGIKAE